MRAEDLLPTMPDGYVLRFGDIIPLGLQAWRAMAFDWPQDLAPQRQRIPPLPIVTWNGAKVHLVTALDGDTARTSCGEVTEDAHLLMSAARELSKPVPCLNCHREERESL